MNTKYWIGVVSRSHVKLGVAGGFAQVCHGKAAPLRRMRAGDWLIYYSPKTDMTDGAPLQRFTAIGQVVDGRVYPFRMSENFEPHRIDIRYTECDAASIQPLLGMLSFIQDIRHWGYPFRTGHFEISEIAFRMIANAMNVNVEHAESIKNEIKDTLF